MPHHIKSAVDRLRERVCEYEVRCYIVCERERILSESVSVLMGNEDAVQRHDVEQAVSMAAEMTYQVEHERLNIKADVTEFLIETKKHRKHIEEVSTKCHLGLSNVILLALSAQGGLQQKLRSLKETLQQDLSRLCNLETDLLSIELRLKNMLITLP